MNNEDVKKYIEKNGNARLVLDTLKVMQAEGVNMTIEELDRRLHPTPATESKPAAESKPAPENEPLITINFPVEEAPKEKQEAPAPQPQIKREVEKKKKFRPAKGKTKTPEEKAALSKVKEKNPVETPKPVSMQAQALPKAGQKAIKKEKKKKEKQPKPPKEKNSDQLLERLALIRTIASVFIAFILVLALAALLIMGLAPDSDIALFIDGLIDPITGAFGSAEKFITLI